MSVLRSDSFAAASLIFLLLRSRRPELDEQLTGLLSRVPYAPSVDAIAKALKYLVALKAVGKLSTLLDIWALNNWRIKSARKAWNFPTEVAVVTGGSSGIGAAIVSSLVAKGVKVAIIDVQPPKDEAKSRNVVYYECDITDQEKVNSTASMIRSDLGSPSILVNNAGIGNSNLILEQTTAGLEKIFRINLFSHYYLLQAFLPDMIANQKGHIVATASIASFIGGAGMADYSATKAGVLAMYEALRVELKHVYNAPFIRLTCVHPTWVRTALTAPFWSSILKTPLAVIEPSTVAAAVMGNISRDRGGQLVVPPSEARLSVFRALPQWIQTVIMDRSAEHVNDIFPPKAS